jgi:molecular chaperone DnaK (HSP70)
MSVVVKRNSKVPCEQRRPFCTMYDNQIRVNIRVYEGERPMVDDNHFLGEFQLSGITPAPRGVTEIEVVFSVSNDGILTVTAQENGMDNIKKELKIDKKQNRLTQADVQRMIDDAVKFAKQDEAHKERMMARTFLEEYITKCQQGILDKVISKGLTDPDRQKIREKCSAEVKYLDQANIAKDVLDQRYKALKKFIDGFDWKI